MRLPRNLHPLAWWAWAIGLAVAVSRTTNPLLLILVLAVLGFVVVNRRTDAPWARAFKYYLGVALVVITIRVVFRAVFGGGVTPEDHILFRLPQVPLPGWAKGVQVGGPVSLEATLSAAIDGLRLGALMCCIGAANTLANPKRALRVLPGALYELGVAVVVAISVAPQLIESGQRVRRARRLRAGGTRGLGAARALVIPVLEDALERSLRLAAGMDTRGFGRTGTATPTSRRVTAGLLVGGMAGLCLGVFGLLDSSAPGWLGMPLTVVGAALCCGGLALGGRRVKRTRYRPDPWRLAEWQVLACGVLPAVVLAAGAGTSVGGLNPSLYPLAWPGLPTLPAVAIVVAALAAVAAPPPARPYRPAPRRVTPAEPTPEAVGA